MLVSLDFSEVPGSEYLHDVFVRECDKSLLSFVTLGPTVNRLRRDLDPRNSYSPLSVNSLSPPVNNIFRLLATAEARVK